MANRATITLWAPSRRSARSRAFFPQAPLRALGACGDRILARCRLQLQPRRIESRRSTTRALANGSTWRNVQRATLERLRSRWLARKTRCAERNALNARPEHA